MRSHSSNQHIHVKCICEEQIRKGSQEGKPAFHAPTIAMWALGEKPTGKEERLEKVSGEQFLLERVEGKRKEKKTILMKFWTTVVDAGVD